MQKVPIWYVVDDDETITLDAIEGTSFVSTWSTVGLHGEETAEEAKKLSDSLIDSQKS